MSTQLSEQDVAAIKASFEDEWVRLGLEGAWDRLMDLMTEDIVFLPPDEPIIEGKSAIRAWFDQFPPIKAYTHQLADVDGREDFAWARGIFTVTVEPEPGKLQSMKGKVVITSRRQSDGSWLVASDMWSLDEPVTEGVLTK
jgi:ketosteroid isomerase-like protein